MTDNVTRAAARSPLGYSDRRVIALSLALLFGLLAALMPAQARAQGAGFPDILEDIFGGKPQQGHPYGQAPAGVIYIENIPVQVSFDSRPDLLPPEATLIVTAIAPPPPNVRRASPLIMGETRLLISRLASPLQMVIAVPSDMAREVDYAEINARIVDANGVETHSLRDRVQYDGGQPPFLNLEPVGALRSGGAAPIYSPPRGQENPNGQYIPPNIAQIEGQISLRGAEPKRGASLILELRENGLAGGLTGNVIEQKRIDIDQIAPPYAFRLNAPMTQGDTLESPELSAWIEDWAGRKTHITPRPVPVRLGDVRGKPAIVNITLDAVSAEQQPIEPERAEPMRADAPPSGFVRTVQGQAQFDAYKGLPAGSVLTVRLRDSARLDRVIASKDIPLDGLSGYIPYALPVEPLDIQGLPSDPLLDAQIKDRTDRLLFTTRVLKTLPREDKGPINIQMDPTPGY